MKIKLILKLILMTALAIGSLFSIVKLMLKDLSNFRSLPIIGSSRRLISEPYHEQSNEQSWQELKLLIPKNSQIDNLEYNDLIEFKIYLYSAYYDWRINKIRINSLVPLSFDDRIGIECAIINEKNIYIGNVSKVIHKEHHDKEYVSSTLLCEIVDNKVIFQEINGEVLLKIFENGNSMNKSQKRMNINIIPRNSSNYYDLSICVRPWWGEPVMKGDLKDEQKFDNAGLLLEFINSHLYLGVNKFYLYQNYLDLDEDVKNVINYYSNIKKVLEIVPFKLPIIPFKQVWDFAQTTMTQDCLLRNIGKTKYLLFIDTDEFVFTNLKDYNLMDFLNLLDTSNSYYKNKVGAMWIPMYFHFLEWESDESNLKKYSHIEKKIKKKMQNLEFILFRKTCRMINSGTKKSQKTRRKVIVKPERVLYMGIHETEEMLSKKFYFIKAPIVNIEEKELSIYLHHYRKAKGIVNNDPKQRELVSMYLENACSNKFIDSSSGSNEGVIVDNIVWETFGTNLYQIIFEHVMEIQNIYTKRGTVKSSKDDGIEKLHN